MCLHRNVVWAVTSVIADRAWTWSMYGRAQVPCSWFAVCTATAIVADTGNDITDLSVPAAAEHSVVR